MRRVAANRSAVSKLELVELARCRINTLTIQEGRRESKHGTNLKLKTPKSVVSCFLVTNVDETVTQCLSPVHQDCNKYKHIPKASIRPDRPLLVRRRA